jgi:SAM-dependent methyltransferase
MELLIGCGNRRDVRIAGRVRYAVRSQWARLVTADIDARCDPDLLIDLNTPPWFDLRGINAHLANPDVFDTAGTLRGDLFDEVHAYEVLEHLGRQGDAPAFFATFAECWRVLKPGGLLCATVPSARSRWLWGDPGHTRAVLPESLTFLIQSEYAQQVGRTPMSDYRDVYRADFEPVDASDDGETFAFILRAVKPSRVKG